MVPHLATYVPTAMYVNVRMRHVGSFIKGVALAHIRILCTQNIRVYIFMYTAKGSSIIISILLAHKFRACSFC